MNLTSSVRAARTHARALTLSLATIATLAPFASRAVHAVGGAAAPAAANSAQVVISGRVLYSTGEPAGGVPVQATGEGYGDNAGMTFSDSSVTDDAGQYRFPVPAACSIVYRFQALPAEVVDGEPLQPSGAASISGCVVADNEMPDMTVVRPRVIAIDGYVKDRAGAGVAGVVVRMRRSKYDFSPPTLEEYATVTDGGGHYTFNSWSRCSIAYHVSATLPGASITPTDISLSGCVLQDWTLYDFVSSVSTAADDARNAGHAPCNSRVGEPVNVTNGNVFLEQTDYRLPGVGRSLAVARTYNSNSRRAGLFGYGWSSPFDESVETPAGAPLRLNLPDGRAVYFDETTAGVFAPRESSDFRGRATRDAVGGFTLSLHGGGAHRFDAAGRLASVTDRYGNRTSLARDPAGKLTSITDPFGRALSVGADGEGRVVALSDAMGAVANYSYGSNGELLSVDYAGGSGYRFAYATSPGLLLTAVTDALGDTVESHAYDARGRALTSERQGGVERVALEYVSDAETRATDALGHVTKFFFDTSRGRNLVTRVEGQCSCGGSQAQSWTYDAAGRATSTTNAKGQRTDYAYDADGNLLSVSDARGRASYTYNQFGQPLTITDAGGATTTNTYDATGKLLSTRDALGATTSFAYDSRSLLLSSTDARSHALSLAYDPHGNLARATDAAGSVTTFSYDARGRLTGEADALGNATRYEYDAAGRPAKVTRADGSTSTFSYDLAGRIIRVTDPRGNNTDYSYDGASRLVREADAVGGAVTYGYDSLSRMGSRTDQLGRTTDFEYDEFGRLVRVTGPAASAGAARLSASVEYDAVGNVLRLTDEAGRTTSFEYDAANRVVRVTDPLLQSTRYEYDARSQVAAVTDALGQRHTYSYDALGRLARAARAGASTSLSYDAVGNLVSRTDYGGAATRYSYDGLDRLTAITYPDASGASYEYDKLSRLTAATNAQGVVRFTYDPLGRVASTTDVFGQTLAYAYDAGGNRASLSVNNALQVSYQYDALDRLARLNDSAGSVVSYAYDAAGRQTARTLPNGVATAYTYDGLNRLTRLTDSAGVGALSDRQYSYDDAGNITRASEGAGAHAYAYDALDRLTSALHPAQTSESYSYDAVGNRAASHRSASYAYQPFNQLTSTATAGYAYDANGNVLSKSDATGVRELSWDAQNRLVEVRLPDGARVAYAYDALGRRVSTASTDARGRRTTTTSHTYDGADVIRETASGRKVETTDYLRGPGTDDLIRQSTRALHGRADTYYHLADHQGTTRLLTDERGRVSDRLDYDAFGDGAASPLTRYAYTGRERDDATGLYYYRARWYDPQLGRFLSEDPIGLSGGINTYTYTSNNPVNRTDPLGLYEIDVHYYLTYYLALRTGCFSQADARLIANSDQYVDENPHTSPGFGGQIPVIDPRPNYDQQQANMDHHALHPNDHQPYLNRLWSGATSGNMMTLSGYLDNLEGLGTYLHYRQDMFSHDGYTDPLYGHSPAHDATHSVDKTDSDVEKSMQMAGATWKGLNDFAKVKCGCQGKSDPSIWKTIRDFSDAPAGNVITRRLFSIEDIDPWYLDNKIRILGLPRR
jgi:RHS repeat-associated protein